MIDQTPTSPTFPSYEECAQGLLELGVYEEPATAHGLLCGLLVSSGGIEVQQWLKVLAPTELLWNKLSATQRGFLSSFIEGTLTQFREPELQFGLFLPEDDEQLEDRVRAFGTWCEGFIRGLTSTGHYFKLPDSPQIKEMLTDLKEISEVDEQVDEEEEQEKAFFELQEYVKVAVVLLQQEFISYRDTSEKEKEFLH